jgi:hypothetical protein
MESTGQPGRVQTSEAVHQMLLTHHASASIGTELRGTIDVKGKGAMNTYWLTQVHD